MTTLFRPIRPKKISEEIVEQIKNLIAQGELKPGGRIPSERELSQLLGVSRPSVREAIMVLEATGFLESRQGGGTYVRSLTENSLTDPLSNMLESKDPAMLHALVEARMGLETWSAYLAAKRARPEDVETLAELLAIMEKQAAKGGWDASVDADFHYAVTAAAQNTIQLHILDTIHSLFHTSLEVALFEFYRRQGYVDLLLSQHREIFQAIRDHNPELARQKMMEHLALVEDKMAQILRGDKA